MVASFLYWVCWKRPGLLWRRIDERPVTVTFIRYDILWSVVTSVLFALQGAFLFYAWEKGWTTVYLSVSDYGWLYLALSFFGLLFFHDSYFYWMHRFLHRPWWYEKVHYVHHRSKSPSPFSAFSFHWVEGIIESLFFFAVPFVLPLHAGVTLFYLLFSTVISVINHLGYELYPRQTLSIGVLRCWITATHHFLHHRLQKGNYGLYFRFWDQWMKTETSHYETIFLSHTQKEIKGTERKAA